MVQTNHHNNYNRQHHQLKLKQLRKSTIALALIFSICRLSSWQSVVASMKPWSYSQPTRRAPTFRTILETRRYIWQLLSDNHATSARIFSSSTTPFRSYLTTRSSLLYQSLTRYRTNYKQMETRSQRLQSAPVNLKRRSTRRKIVSMTTAMGAIGTTHSTLFTEF